MKRFLRILAASLLAAACLVSCSNKARVIPRGTMSKIYAEMFLRDQWITNHPGVRKSADTSFVYRPILEKYGYTEEDYRASVEKYMEDPERYARILKKSEDILNKRHGELVTLKNQLDAVRLAHEGEEEEYVRGFRALSGLKNPSNSVEDPAVFCVDSFPGKDWRFDPYAGYDSLWRGPLLDIDTTRVRLDTTLVQIDSTLVQLDSALVQIDSTAVQIDSALVQIDTSCSISMRLLSDPSAVED